MDVNNVMIHLNFKILDALRKLMVAYFMINLVVVLVKYLYMITIIPIVILRLKAARHMIIRGECI